MTKNILFNIQACCVPFIASLALAGTGSVAAATSDGFHDAQQIINPDAGAGPASNDHFGISLSLSGQRLAVGSGSGESGSVVDAGAVHVYTRSNGSWTLSGQAIPNDPVALDQFCNVALDGNRLFVGASRKGNGVGAAYVFEHQNDGSWLQMAKFLPGNPNPGCGDPYGCHLFGGPVALSGDTAVATAHTENSRRGAVYVFVRAANGIWSQQARLQAADGVAHAHFGNTVAISGDTIIVGADHASVSAGTNAGAAYVFVRQGTTWTQQAKLVASDGAASDAFGFSVDTDGTSAVVGAYRRSVDGVAARGAAYVFLRQGTIWTQQARLQAPGGVASDQFGYVARILGDYAAISTRPGEYSVPAADRNGSGYLFRRRGSQWSLVDRIAPADGANGDGFGSGLALDAGYIAIGAAYEGRTPHVVNRGSTYVYARVPGDRIFADDLGA